MEKDLKIHSMKDFNSKISEMKTTNYENVLIFVTW